MQGNDILLIFVPQWSPFQPPLSLPSLTAWLRRSGYSVDCMDANIMFYDWLLSKDCVPHLLRSLGGNQFDENTRRAYRTIFECHEDFSRDIAKLRTKLKAQDQVSERALLPTEWVENCL